MISKRSSVVVIFLLMPYVRAIFFSSQSNPNADKVEIKWFYEVLCPHGIKFQTKILAPVVKEFRNHLILKPVPFGHAKYSTVNGEVKLHCQHGKRECYGNKLNACAMYVIGNMSLAVLFNACMMDAAPGGPYVKAAEKCGRAMKIDSLPIKACAGGLIGDMLMRYYGVESKKADFEYVPYVTVNGERLNDYRDLRQIVCQALHSPPPSCYMMH